MNVTDLLETLDAIDSQPAPRPGFAFVHASRVAFPNHADRAAFMACPVALEVPITTEAWQQLYTECVAYQTTLRRVVLAAEAESSRRRVGRA